MSGLVMSALRALKDELQIALGSWIGQINHRAVDPHTEQIHIACILTSSTSEP